MCIGDASHADPNSRSPLSIILQKILYIEFVINLQVDVLEKGKWNGDGDSDKDEDEEMPFLTNFC